MAALRDGEWAVLKTALDRIRTNEGRRFEEKRRTLEAVIWRRKDGTPGRGLPAAFGPWWRAAQLTRKGRWARLLEALRDEGRSGPGEAFPDGSSIRAHQKPAGAKGRPG